MRNVIDAYRKNNSIVLWTSEGRTAYPYVSSFFVESCERAERALRARGLSYKQVLRTTVFKQVLVYEVRVPPSEFERAISQFERDVEFRVPLFNADVKPEQAFLYDHDLVPFADETALKTLRLEVPAGTIVSARLDDEELTGDERTVLEKIAAEVVARDPDVISMPNAFRRLPELAEKMERYGIPVPFHRWDHEPIRYKGGRSFWRYGSVTYREYSIRLRGRLLLDEHSFIGHECDVEAVMELCRLSGALFQHLAGRSPGAVFQSALMRALYKDGYLLPYKEKPLDKPISMKDLLMADRAGHILDPRVGFQRDVAEIDFASMFPWLMVKHNLSAEAILSDKQPRIQAPGIPTSIASQEGYVGKTLRPFIERRMYYKNNPTRINKLRSKGLKWVLVSSYGYLRFREFKLGLAAAHQACCAFARETLIDTMHLAEEQGFEVLHGIVDSLYVRSADEAAVKSLVTEVERQTGIPVAFEGLFKWVVFLPSVRDDARPLPHRYYGAYRSGGFKARGVEVRQKSAPFLVRAFQQSVLEEMSLCDTKEEVNALYPRFKKRIDRIVTDLDAVPGKDLACKMTISKERYTRNIPQAQVVKQLRTRPGMKVSFVHTTRGVVVTERYKGSPDKQYYRNRLARALDILYQPLNPEQEQKTLAAYE